MDGTGEIAQDQSGAAEWLIIPYSIAAPERDTLYDVGGTLAYTVAGAEFSVPLLPDVITVKPNPSLVVHYFHEKYVQGDDALTPEVEPIVPFSLAVMVMNNGYGVARELHITSAQPEIVESEKGLLVTFKIIGAQLGMEPVTPSLTVDFGDIASFETKTARWLLTSTLKGTFYNYTATFENINPLGDPQLSLLDELAYHELIHLVRIDIESSPDDGLDDFLVNNRIDAFSLPDRLYDSANGSSVYEVHIANLTDLSHSVDTFKSHIIVNITVEVFTKQWYYIRLENNITRPNIESEQLRQAEKHDNSTIHTLVMENNVWLTTHILDTFYIHVLDFIEGNESESTRKNLSYILYFGAENNAPTFNRTEYRRSIPITAPVDHYILTVQAYDIDNDALYFEILSIDSASTPFRIDESSGRLYVASSTLKEREYILEVLVRDKGVPPRSATVNVYISVSQIQATPTAAPG